MRKALMWALVVVAVCSLGWSQKGFASPVTDLSQRIENQQRRIDDGIAKRQLTRHEAEVVQDNLDWIRDTFARMKSDGRLTGREINKLEELLDSNSQLIAKKRHNFERYRDQKVNVDFFIKF
jgi:hypothetical protein